MDAEFPIPQRLRQSLSFQLIEQFYRLSPELRAAAAEDGAGGIAIPFHRDDWPAVLEVLRAMPDDAGQAALLEALAPFARVVEDDSDEQAV